MATAEGANPLHASAGEHYTILFSKLFSFSQCQLNGEANSLQIVRVNSVEERFKGNFVLKTDTVEVATLFRRPDRILRDVPAPNAQVRRFGSQSDLFLARAQRCIGSLSRQGVGEDLAKQTLTP